MRLLTAINACAHRWFRVSEWDGRRSGCRRSLKPVLQFAPDRATIRAGADAVGVGQFEGVENHVRPLLHPIGEREMKGI